jgi:ABC-type hemin transport system ATPase subunit
MITVLPATSQQRVRDLRGTAVDRLEFPARSMVLLAGIPGAGKTTLLRRLYTLTGRERLPVLGSDGALVLDSEHARNWWSAWLHGVPYRRWRPLVHLTHHVRLLRALRRDEPIVLHECGTRDWLFQRIVDLAARHHRQVHVLLLDVSASAAQAGQVERGRTIHPGRFARHAHQWQSLLWQAQLDPAGVLPGATSVTLIDRATADRLSTIAFFKQH